ncbi:hypothetical protein M422DRAFT_69393 [Sphaerobolus stellatus SS14]|uniref:uS12 prolyl 3,4-dihydroxylase n=1 Tax=Sphaerobolus stellatus (strain SS14) TaxID=990650 RepID=A0A0C9VJG0_SPHS4|nr:hypothetical protein M422DRAFT_69393 [Sphaerobolus stellatus SS14]
MAPGRARSPSPFTANKRLKPDSPSGGDAGLISSFAAGILEPGKAEGLHQAYMQSEPYKYCVLDKLFIDTLLKKVKDECIGELNFTEKATDIYKVHQTGDLASLSYLPKEQLDLLPSLLTLRDALYSPEFRQFLRTVTGCGPLSGSKQDMSVNSYKTGCHLLNHDDVIGTRCVSYILYMPLPEDKHWEEAWGGALELYPVSEEGELQPIPSKKIPPSWNQFIFFEVQPGKSFHSVEEVVVGGGNDSRERLSISGWFHKAQEGEEGYQPEPTDRVKSSLEQLSAGEAQPLNPYPSEELPPIPPVLSDNDITFLSQFISEPYLKAQNLSLLAERFGKESTAELHLFLREDLAKDLEKGLRELDAKDGLMPSKTPRIPPHSSGVQEGSGWRIKGPPQRQRFCVIEGPQSDSANAATKTLRRIQDELFPSSAFRSWLAVVTSLIPMQYAVQARRFRPGLDYTLATSEDSEARLDVVLGLTPDVEISGKGKKKADGNWESGEWGGWECYLAAPDENEDPAVYGSGRKSKKDKADGDAEEDEEDEDDSTLLVAQPGFNRLLLALRDAGVLHFVKYVQDGTSLVNGK